MVTKEVNVHQGGAASGIPLTLERPAFVAATATLALTSVHHVYGAVRYGTPERYHAVVIAAVTLSVLAVALLIHRRDTGSAFGGAAWWLFWVVTAGVPVLVFGAVEGFYNHVVKVALYFGGASATTLGRMFPPPTYVLPNDAIFETTGVLQVVPAAVTGYYLIRLLIDRWKGSAPSIAEPPAG